MRFGIFPAKRLDFSERSMANWNQFGPAYDHQAYEGWPRTYLIASTPRCGSHYLGHLLFETGQLGSPLEYLHPAHNTKWQEILGATTSEEAMRRLFRRRTSPSGWFGLKAHWSQFASALKDPELMDVLNIETFIFLQRRDALSQAISLVIARQTGAWISFHEQQRRPVYSFEEIEAALAEVEEECQNWREYFQKHEISPLEFEYEDIVAEPGCTVSAIARALGVDIPSSWDAPSCGPKKQASFLNRTWYRRFLFDKKRKRR